MPKTSRTIQDLQPILPWQPPINSVDRHYRHKARLAIDARNPNDIRLGFRQQGSNQIFSLKQCPVLVPELEALIQPLQELLSRIQKPLKIGHITLLQGDTESLMGVNLVKPLSDLDQQTFHQFATEHHLELVLHSPSSSSSQLTGISNKSKPLSYKPVESLKLNMYLDDFVQVNAQVNQKMIAQALQWLELDEQDSVLDLFCGIGNFSLPIAQHSKFVLGIEGVAKMVQRGAKNAQNNAITNCVFKHWDLSESDWLIELENQKFNKVLLDPSREGAKQAIQCLPKLAPSHILYVSCNPATFARDTASLLTQNYRLDKIALMDMFPQTAHTELMALFVPSISKHT